MMITTWVSQPQLTLCMHEHSYTQVQLHDLPTAIAPLTNTPPKSWPILCGDLQDTQCTPYAQLHLIVSNGTPPGAAKRLAVGRETGKSGATSFDNLQTKLSCAGACSIVNQAHGTNKSEARNNYIRSGSSAKHPHMTPQPTCHRSHQQCPQCQVGRHTCQTGCPQGWGSHSKAWGPSEACQPCPQSRGEPGRDQCSRSTTGCLSRAATACTAPVSQHGGLTPHAAAVEHVGVQAGMLCMWPGHGCSTAPHNTIMREDCDDA